MNLMQRPLWPALGVIENRLFSPSDPLIQRWLGEDPGLSRELRAALDESPDATARCQLMQECTTATPDWDPAEPLPLPSDLRHAIRRRMTASQAAFAPLPVPGQIVAVTRLVGPDGPLDWDLQQPLAVLLNAPTEVSQVWHGWMVASETDYAGPWDLLLEDQDGPVDPLAGMVQLWNPVGIYLAGAGPVLAQLSAPRLQALRALVAEFLIGRDPDPTLARPGHLVSHRAAGLEVLTGTPLGDAHDARRRYQMLYHTAAAALGEPARLAMAAAARGNLEGWLQAVADAIGAAAQAIGLGFGPTREVSHAMSAMGEVASVTDGIEDSARTDRLPTLPVALHFCLEGDLHLDISEQDGALRIGLRAGDLVPWTVSLYGGDELLQCAQLTHSQAQDEVFCDPSEAHTLVVTGGPPERPVLLKIPLPPIR